MTKLKVGDTVRRVKGDHQGMSVGDTDTVVGYGSMIVNLKRYGEGHGIMNLELVPDKYPPGEYTLSGGNKAVVYETVGDRIFGRHLDSSGDLFLCWWDSKTGHYGIVKRTNGLDLPPVEEPEDTCDGKTVTIDGKDYVLKLKE